MKNLLLLASVWQDGYETGIMDERQASALDIPEYRSPNRSNPFKEIPWRRIVARRTQNQTAPTRDAKQSSNPAITESWDSLGGFFEDV